MHWFLSQWIVFWSLICPMTWSFLLSLDLEANVRCSFLLYVLTTRVYRARLRSFGQVCCLPLLQHSHNLAKAYQPTPVHEMSFILPAEVLVHVVLERLVPREWLGVAERAGELRDGARVEARVPLVVALREELGVAVLALELAHARVPRLVRPLFGRACCSFIRRTSTKYIFDPSLKYSFPCPWGKPFLNYPSY